MSVKKAAILTVKTRRMGAAEREKTCVFDGKKGAIAGDIGGCYMGWKRGDCMRERTRMEDARGPKGPPFSDGGNAAFPGWKGRFLHPRMEADLRGKLG